jgi:hypothetical protein
MRFSSLAPPENISQHLHADGVILSTQRRAIAKEAEKDARALRNGNASFKAAVE